MKKSLFKSALFVWFFWWTILFVFFNDLRPDGVGMIPSFINGIILSVMACTFGFAIQFVSARKEIEDAKDNLKPTWNYGLKTSLGGFPPIKQHPRADSFTIPNDLVPWFQKYRLDHPKHAAVFEAVLRIYEAKPIPASPIKGGHGGLNLRDHSFNVLREILIAKSSFQYVGSKTANGTIRQGLNDKTYQFDQTDPAIPLLGFIHDLGKMNCYKVLPNGLVEEIRINHDIQGSKTLVGLEEFKILTADSQDLKNALSVIMAYYHHPVEMPLWADDHTRALTELLITADNAASKKEGGYKAEYVDDAIAAQNGNVQAGYLMAIAEGAAESVELIKEEIGVATLEQLDGQNIVTTDDNLSEKTPESEQKTDVKPVKPVGKYAAKEKSDSKTPGFIERGVDNKYLILGETLFNKLKVGIYKNSSLMDTSAGDASIGFVKNDLFYFHDQSMRKYLQLVTGDNALIQDKPGKQNVHSFALMTYLMKNDWLYCVHDGLNYSSNRAVFTVEKTRKVDGKTKTTTTRFMIIINAEAFTDNDHQKIADTKLGIKIAGNSWGANNDFKLKTASQEVTVETNPDFEAFIGNTTKTDGAVEPAAPLENVPVEVTQSSGDDASAAVQTTAADMNSYLDYLLTGETAIAPSVEQKVDEIPHVIVQEPQEPQEITALDVTVQTHENDSDDSENEYIEPENRIGILAVIAKLQYENNKKLTPCQTKVVGGNVYLYYHASEICKNFQYSEDDLIYDILQYRNEKGNRKIGTQTLDSGVLSVFIRASEIDNDS